MAYFNSNHGIVKEENDLKWETPEFAKNFWEWILGEPLLEQPKPDKVNLLK